MPFARSKIIIAGVVALLWFSFLGYWLITARKTKRTKLRDKRLLKALLIPGVFAGVFMYILTRLPGWLTYEVFSGNPIVVFVGIFICMGGLSFSLWARNTLGDNWSGVVTLKEEHELIQTGPYRIVRHPIYTGVVFAALGTAIAFKELIWILMTFLLFYGFLIKSNIEEELLCQEFPEKYPEYIRKVKKLIPFLF